MSDPFYDSISKWNTPDENKEEGRNEEQPLHKKYTPSDLQVKLEKQRDHVRITQPLLNGNLHHVANAPKKTSLMSVTRLQIPKSSGYQKLHDSPLVELESDSEDEVFLSLKQASKARQFNKELSQQLARDGFQLDEMPDDEDLDLIPPSEFRKTEQCTCCNTLNMSCTIS